MLNMTINVASALPGCIQNDPVDILRQRFYSVQSSIGLEQINVTGHMKIGVNGIFYQQVFNPRILLIPIGMRNAFE